MLFGGHMGPAHSHKPSAGDADMWDGSDERDAGAEMFSNLSVSCCMSPTGEYLGTFTVRHHTISPGTEVSCILCSVNVSQPVWRPQRQPIQLGLGMNMKMLTPMAACMLLLLVERRQGSWPEEMRLWRCRMRREHAQGAQPAGHGGPAEPHGQHCVRAPEALGAGAAPGPLRGGRACAPVPQPAGPERSPAAPVQQRVNAEQQLHSHGRCRAALPASSSGGQPVQHALPGQAQQTQAPGLLRVSPPYPPVLQCNTPSHTE